jgi:hypothetical protein
LTSGLFTKNSNWQAKQSIPHITVTFYGDCVKTCEHFAPNFGYKRTGCCITTTHRLALPFSPGNVFPHPTWLSPPPPTFLFPRLKTKLKGHHFDTIGVIEAESRVVLNTFKDGHVEPRVINLGTRKKCQQIRRPGFDSRH